jgi:hypothetical protein
MSISTSMPMEGCRCRCRWDEKRDQVENESLCSIPWSPHPVDQSYPLGIDNGLFTARTPKRLFP